MVQPAADAGTGTQVIEFFLSAACCRIPSFMLDWRINPRHQFGKETGGLVTQAVHSCTSLDSFASRDAFT